MVNWYVDKGLGTLISQEKAKHPGMVVGTIAGTQHHKDNPTSDHEPEADGSVDAADFMLGTHFTKADASQLVTMLQLHRDRRIAYVIWDHHIMSSTIAPWTWRDYVGADPHTGHVHVSVNDLHESDNSAWNLGGKMHKYEELEGFGLPVLNQGDNDKDFDGYHGVGRAQTLLNYQGYKIDVDGIYGDRTALAVKNLVGGNGRQINRAVWVKLAGLSRSV